MLQKRGKWSDLVAVAHAFSLKGACLLGQVRTVPSTAAAIICTHIQSRQWRTSYPPFHSQKHLLDFPGMVLEIVLLDGLVVFSPAPSLLLPTTPLPVEPQEGSTMVLRYFTD